jgi:type VI secretion system protein ImpH
VPVEIQEFVGAWYTLTPENQSDLAAADRNNCLGEGAIAGDAVWDPQARFQVRLGPLSLDRFLEFLPEAKAVRELRDLVRFYVGPVPQFDLQLVLMAKQVPGARLGDQGADGPRLGWCGWLKTEEFTRDVGDLQYAVV